jgi:type III restriction enzyme
VSVPLPADLINVDLIDQVSQRLDLRKPNREALELLAYRISEHYNVDHLGGEFEAVCDVATGVGKTYILAGAIEYFAGLGTRNFAVVTPGRTILNKTVAQFSEGTSRSLLGQMDVELLVVTSENFNTPAVAAAFEDDDQVKLFVFTVQSLLRPTSKSGRKTHAFQEGLGKAFYAHLQQLDDLIVFADEHHVYDAPQFSAAVRDLTPYALIGLTATPKRRSADKIVYRYPLSAAIADELVKAPVIVGRQDDRSDPETKLRDGATLLEAKQEAIDSYVRLNGLRKLHAVMLVVAKSIDDAKIVSDIVRSDAFFGGRYRDAVLEVHSEASGDEREQMLADLDAVEESDSRVRVIVSVGMLKEGWDVSNVYVIVSLRSSVSEILTEQTLGRGLRLPFGAYTGIEFLDSLEVVAHERYRELLAKKDLINEQFVDLRTHIEMRKNRFGQTVPVAVEEKQGATVLAGEEGDGAAAVPGTVALTDIADRTTQAEESAKATVELPPRADLPTLLVPRVKLKEAKAEFSLAQIVFNSRSNVFKELGERIATDPNEALQRTRIEARVEIGPDGLRYTVTRAVKTADKFVSQGKQLSLETGRAELESRILNAPNVPDRMGQRAALQPILDTFIEGLSAKAGDNADEILSAYLDRTAGALIELITAEQRRLTEKPVIEHVLDVEVFAPLRQGRPETSDDLRGRFKRGVGYVGWVRSMYAQAWFDSAPEREVASAVDDADDVAFWVRLNRGDLPIAWEAGTYNPDLIVIESDGTHWVVEVEGDNAMSTTEVQAKRLAAQQWANHVTADPKLNGTKWRYLLVRETDIAAAKGSWGALKGFGAL